MVVNTVCSPTEAGPSELRAGRRCPGHACWSVDAQPNFWRIWGLSATKAALVFPSLLALLLSLLAGLVGLSGCASSGGDSLEPTTAAPPMRAQITGNLIVPPNHIVEVEPNNTIAQAQEVMATVTVSGSVAVSDPGFRIPGTDGVEVGDLYTLRATARVQLILTMVTDDPDANDLDLLLMDRTGNVMDVSEGGLATEVLETPGAGDFVVGVRAFQGSSAYVLSITSSGSPAGAPASAISPEAVFVPGEILVKLRADDTGRSQSPAKLAAQYGLSYPASASPGATLMTVSAPRALQQPGKLSPLLPLRSHSEETLQALTLDTMRRLRADPKVAYAEPNFVRHPAFLPNDELFSQQWPATLINLPAAWEITTGSDSVIVAVIDTGILFDHPDLQSRLMPGYDFINDPGRANDGDGMDPDPNDAGDAPDGLRSSFHGTHVAGIIGATTHNTIGVAGVTWHTRMMPLRVSGVGGATDADLAQAIRYAAGLPNRSGTLPSEPAQIINISLAGPGFSHTLQEAIQAATAQGIIVIAAAGNGNTNTLFYPASFDEVISVSAVDVDLQKASYANFGTAVDVVAPGGNIYVDHNGDGFDDGVLSTLGDDTGQFFYETMAGTSMASPHIAGICALMLAVNPQITSADITRLLAGTHPETTRPITWDFGPAGRDDRFGYGIIDAAEAVQVAQSISGGMTAPPVSRLLVSTTTLHFESFISALPIDITNAGSGTLQITSITSDAPWLKLTLTSGTAPLTVHAVVDRSDLAVGMYTTTIQTVSDASAGDATVPIQVEVESADDTQGNIGTAFVLVLDATTLDTVSQVKTESNDRYAFTISHLAPGSYRLIAGTDRDHDGVICETGDACGLYPDPITMTAGHNSTDISLVVQEPIASPGTTPGFARLQRTTFSRLY